MRNQTTEKTAGHTPYNEMSSQLPLEQHRGERRQPPAQLQIHLELLTPPNLPTISLLLPRSLTHNINSQLTYIFYATCIIYRILTIE